MCILWLVGAFDEQRFNNIHSKLTPSEMGRLNLVSFHIDEQLLFEQDSWIVADIVVVSVYILLVHYINVSEHT